MKFSFLPRLQLAVVALVLFLIGIAMPAQVSGGVIPVMAIKKETDGVTLAMEQGLLKIQVCTDRIVRVIYDPTDFLHARESFVVTRRWTPVPFKVDETKDAVTVSTGKLQVRVDKPTGAVAFLDVDGKVLLTEPSAGGRKMTPVEVNKEKTYQVEQTFECPPDEKLYGMGQFQDGLWNWRGIPIELRQHNTHAAVPVLISSKGYGLLWDNASLTDFNPVDVPISLVGRDVPANDESGAPKATEDLQNATKLKAAALQSYRTGIFTAEAAGEYVFTARDGDRKDELTLLVNDQEVAGIKNMWVPYTVTGKVTLATKQKCEVAVRGGGANVKAYARPLGHTTTFRSQVGDTIDYVFFYGPQLDDVIANYRLATGVAPLWPKWAYGFWQCRERYSSQQQMVDAAAEFRRRQIPIDLIVQDWQYWGRHGWGAYDWNATCYPDPAAMIKQLHDLNIKYMISVWSNPSGGEIKEALGKINGYIPTKESYIDVFNPEARAVRWDYMNKAFFSIGTDAWWQDATEPSDAGNVLDNVQVSLGSGNRYRNAYPLFASRGTYEGQRQQNPDKRVVNLTRSSYPGMQRYGAAAWSGDVNGDWKTFARQIPAGLNYCLTGQPYWTTDVGGFFHPSDQYTSEEYNELLTRWFQWSTFGPILRIHGYKTETEMWKWLPETQKNLLAYDTLRYRMLPYIYSVAWKVTNEGYTTMRALPMDFAADPKVWDISDQYMFGPAFLVTPVTEYHATTRKVYLPAGTNWTNFWTGEVTPGGREVTAPAARDTIPIFVRAGSIVPFGPTVQYAMEKPADPIELRIYRGADGAFTLYEDEGDSYNYEKGIFATIPMQWNEQTATLTIGKREGDFPGMLYKRTFRIIWVTPGHGVGAEPTEQADREVIYSGESLSVHAP